MRIWFCLASICLSLFGAIARAQPAPAPTPTVAPAPPPAAASSGSSSGMWVNEDKITWPLTGVGLSVGTISGLSFYHTNAASAFFQGLLAFDGEGDYFISADFCNILEKMLPKIPRLDPYYGFGLMSQRYDRDSFTWGLDEPARGKHRFLLGARIPLGMNYAIPETPLQVGVELAPGILLTPGTLVTVQAAVNLRVLF